MEEVVKGFLARDAKNPRDAVRIASICDELQDMHDTIVDSGDSPREITVVDLQHCIDELRVLSKRMSKNS